SGLCGSMASLWWNPAIVSVGASGAIFGIFGALLAFFAQNGDRYKQETIGKYVNGILVFVGANLFLGFATPGIDNAAHAGGVISGFLIGLLISTPSSAL